MTRWWRRVFRRRAELPGGYDREGFERIIAFARLPVAVAALATVHLDSPAPAAFAAIAYVAAIAYLAYAVLVAAVLWLRVAPVSNLGRVSNVCDLGWAFILTSLTGGVSSHFAPPLFVFAELAAAYRWGFRATLATGLAAGALMIGEALLATASAIGAPLKIGDFITRTGWVVLVGVILGFLAEREKRLRAESSVLARISRRVSVDAGLDASFRGVIHEVSGALGAGGWLLIMEEAISHEVLLWTAPNTTPLGSIDEQPIQADPSQRATYAFPVPPEASAWGARRSPLPGRDPLTWAVDAEGRPATCTFRIPDRFPGSAPWQSLLCLSTVAIESWFGRLLFVNPAVDVGNVERLRFLQTVWQQVGPALTNIDLLRRLRAKIVEIQAARAEAVTARNRIEAVMDAIPVGVAIIDDRGGRISANNAFENVWGKPLPPAAAVADYASYKAWWMDTGSPVRPDEWASARAVMHGETVVGQAMRIARFDGTSAFVLNSAAPVLDARGEVAGGVVVIQDVTRRVTAEQALAESRAALEHANHELRDANDRLRLANETLELRVAERTADLTRRTAQLQALAGELTMAEERERRRVAEVIHDHLQQLLAGARINLEIMRLGGRTAPVEEELKALDALMAEALEAARTLTAELSPSVLYRGDLAIALQWLARWFRERHALEVEVEGTISAGAEAQDVRVVLFRSVSELLFNVVKHAGVRTARVHVSQTGEGAVKVVVSDDGAGFEPEQARKHEGTQGGFGLFSVRERLELLGGSLGIESAPGRGTRMTIVAPPPPPAGAHSDKGNPTRSAFE